MERPKKLSAQFVKTVANPGRYGDRRGGCGLSLLVQDSNTGRLAKSWAQRLRINGQPFNVGLGSYPIVSLARAREKALENARAVEQGHDPRVKAARIPTVAECVDRVIEVMRPNWRHHRTEQQLRYFITKHALPHIGNKPVDAVTPGDVLQFLVPLAISIPASARKTKAALHQVFQWAVAQGLRQGNPTEGISAALPKLNAREHHKALPYSQVASAIKTVRETTAWEGTKLAFEFMVLTAARSGEVRLAQWSEIDLGSAMWIIPAHRMKAGREHRVPLSRAALYILDEARALTGGQSLVFPSSTGQAMSDSTISKLLRSYGVEAVPHGFRSSFRDWAGEKSNASWAAIESSLAHSIGSNVEKAYFRSDMLDQRRTLLESWAAYISDNQDAC